MMTHDPSLVKAPTTISCDILVLGRHAHLKSNERRDETRNNEAVM